MSNNDNFVLLDRENTPDWLINHKKGEKININHVFDYRTLFYPGSGHDTYPIQVFNPFHIVHTYIYVDYCHDKEETINHLSDHFFEGYLLYDLQEFGVDSLKAKNWTPHYNLTEEDCKRMPKTLPESYGLVAIYELKDTSRSDVPKRFAIVYLCSDAIAAYDALFQTYKAPYAMLLHDHGFGGNYNRFGADGAMYEIAKKINAFPKYILSSRNTMLWEGYKQIASAEKLPYFHIERDLYMKDDIIDDLIDSLDLGDDFDPFEKFVYLLDLRKPDVDLNALSEYKYVIVKGKNKNALTELAKVIKNMNTKFYICTTNQEEWSYLIEHGFHIIKHGDSNKIYEILKKSFTSGFVGFDSRDVDLVFSHDIIEIHQGQNSMRLLQKIDSEHIYLCVFNNDRISNIHVPGAIISMTNEVEYDYNYVLFQKSKTFI